MFRPPLPPSLAMLCRMHSFLAILDGIDHVNRNFLWGSNDHVRKMHWVNWDVVTKPKDAGGLGLQSAKGRNTALLALLYSAENYF